MTQTQLQSLIYRYRDAWTVNWSNYDREAIVRVLKTNTYIFSIISKIARAAKTINIAAGNTVNGEFIEDPNSELLKNLKSPNPYQSQKEFIEQAVTQFNAFGEIFICFDTYEGGNSRGKMIPGTLELAPPNLMDIKAVIGKPVAYVVNGDVTRTLPAENVIHVKAYNPDYQDLHGLPYIAVAGKMIDKINAATEAETKTFQNTGPATMVVPKNVDSINTAEFTGFMGLIRRIWKSEARGVAGVNVPMEFHQMGSNPTDMGTIESQNNTLQILLTLWGLDAGLFTTEASTFNNKQVMERAVYTEAALPTLERIIEKLNSRFGQIYKVELVADTSAIEVLQPSYRERVEWMTLAGVFTDNEIREALSYDRRDGEESDLTPSEAVSSTALEGFNDVDQNVIE